MLTERELQSFTPIEIDLEPKKIAQVLRSAAERPTKREIEELKEIGIDQEGKNIWRIFLFDGLRRIEQHLTLNPDDKELLMHARILTEVLPVNVVGTEDQAISIDADQKLPPTLNSSELGTIRINNLSSVIVMPMFGHVRFENETQYLDVYHDCKFASGPKSPESFNNG